MPDVTPIRELARRMPEQGRIRIGQQVPTKSGKTRPDKLDVLRFTSRDQDAIEQIAALYGGECRPWDGAPGATQWEVITRAKEIPVILPPDCLGGTPVYEEWNRGGVLRRCDGEFCDQPQDTPEGTELIKVPCLCQAEGTLRCKPKLRLSVVLRDIKFGGTWRLETGGWNAVHEIPGMVDMIHAMQAHGLTLATLKLEQRTKVSRGKTNHYAVPVLGMAESVENIVAGGQQMQALQGSAPKFKVLDAGDDEVVEAEVVGSLTDEQSEKMDDQVTMIVDGWNHEHPEGPLSNRQVLQALSAQVTGNPNQQVHALDEHDGERIIALLDDIVAGKVSFRGMESGRVKVKRGA